MGLISALEKKMVIATSDDDDDTKPLVLPSFPRSPLRKGGAGGDPASVTATESNNTACTSPLTITSLEQAAAAAAVTTSSSASTTTNNNLSSSSSNNPSWVPQVVSSRGACYNISMPLSGGASSSSEKQRRTSDMIMAEDHNTGRKAYQRTPPTEHDNRKLFVGGLPTDVTDGKFLEFFQQFGQVVDSVVMVDRLTKRSRGFGFVTFATEAEANTLLTNIPGKTGHVLINGKQCEVKASTPKSNTDDSARTYHNRYPTNNSGSVVPGMWRSNPPYYHHHNNSRGYKPRHFIHNNNYYNTNHTIGSQPLLDFTKQQEMLYQHPQNHENNVDDDDDDDKLLDIENEFSGDVNRRNFTPVYPASMNYHALNNYGYGRNLNLYQQPTYPPNALFPTGYVYLNDGSDASTISSSYPPPALSSSQGYGTNTAGYFDHYAASAAQQQQYLPYGNPLPYSNSTQSSTVLSSPGLVTGMIPQVGYEMYNNGYYAEGTTEGYNTTTDTSFDLEGIVAEGASADADDNNGGEASD